MQKKIYVMGMDDDETAAKVADAVKVVSGVTNVVASAPKCQVCVDFDETATGVEEAINAAIGTTGAIVLG